MLGYRAKQQEDLSPLEYELNLVNQQISAKEIEWQQARQDFKLSRSERLKTSIAADIEMIEKQLDGFQERQKEIQSRIDAAGGSEKEISSLLKFSKLIRENLAQIDLDFESRRLLIEQINIQVTLNFDNERKEAIVTGKIIPDKLSSCLESTPSQ